MILNNNTNLSLLLKREIRKALGARNNCPFKILEGKNPPKLKGFGYYYTNKSGDIIRHPIAYRKAWGKPRYHHSTIRIEVGGDWLLDNLTLRKIKEFKLKAFL